MAPGMMGWDPGRPTGGCGVGMVLSWRRHPYPAPVPPCTLSPVLASLGWAGHPLETVMT